MNLTHELIDGLTYKVEKFGNNLEFLLEKELIYKRNDGYKVNFVGKVINNYEKEILISYPKNTNTKLDIDFIFDNYSNVKKDNKILLSNYSFDKSGNKIFSEYNFYQKFLFVFSDLLTNDFLIPKKQTYSYKGSKIDIFKTMFSLPKENKITYKQDDKSEFYVRNVFYSILKYLESKYACNKEKKVISDLENFYTSKGYIFNIIDIPEKIPFVEVNHKSLLGFKLLNDYLNLLKKSKKYEVNVFYTDKFEYIYEYMLKKVLKHNKDYKKNNTWKEPDYKKSDIDIYNDSFMGDSKYYNLNDLESYSFTKELYEYNLCAENKIPNYVFILSNETKLNKIITHQLFKLNIYEISINELIQDLKHKTYIIYEILKKR